MKLKTLMFGGFIAKASPDIFCYGYAYETLILLMILFRYFFNGNLSFPENPDIMSGWEGCEDGHYIQQLLSLNFAKRSTFKSKHMNHTLDGFYPPELSCFSYKLFAIYTMYQIQELKNLKVI